VGNEYITERNRRWAATMEGYDGDGNAVTVEGAGRNERDRAELQHRQLDHLVDKVV
jgi:hypothetical protein